MLIILRGIADFLKSKGYWPTKRELKNRMHTELSVVDWYVWQNQEAGRAVLHGGKWKDRRRIELTAAGWTAIKRAPYPPRKHPPGSDKRKQYANSVAKIIDKARAEEATG